MALFRVGVSTYLIICRKDAYLLKVIIMSSTNNLSLPQRAAICRERIDQCADIIKQLQGDTPDGCKITFSIRSATIVKFDIDDSESWLMLSLFMGWLNFYRKELKRITQEMAA